MTDSYLRWPPPGLERIQGDLWRIVGELLIGGSILVFPLLWAVGEARPFASAGPFGETWWIVLVTSVLGVAILLSAAVKLFRLLRRAATGVREGYGWRTIALVAADGKRENGFLLQGGRAYSVLEPRVRHRLARARLWIAGAWFMGALWHPLGFVLGVLLASRGFLSEAGLVWLTAAPSFVCFLGGYLLSAWQYGILAAARREWHKRPWSRDLERDEIRHWREDLARRGEEGARWEPSPSPRAGSFLRVASWSVVLGALFVVIPSLALVVSSSVSPVLTMVSAPGLGETVVRAAGIEPLRPFRLPADPTVTPQIAGEAAHVLSGLSGTLPSEFERPPVRAYPEGMALREAARIVGMDPGMWGVSLYSAWDTLSPEAQAAVRRVAEHPALEELSVMGRAASVDLIGTRWVSPLPDGLNAMSIPFPRFGALREAGYAAAAKAVIEFKSGRPEEAERTIREVIGVGILLLDDGPTLIENLIGTVIARNAGHALAALYRETGRAEEADELEDAILAAEAVARMARAGWSSDPYGVIRGMPTMVLDPYALRGLRWDAFARLSSIAPCMNANRIVFGPDEAYATWLGRTRSALVRLPSEDTFYDVMSRGWFGGGDGNAPTTALGRLFTITMGGDGPGSCARIFEAMGSVGVF